MDRTQLIKKRRKKPLLVYMLVVSLITFSATAYFVVDAYGKRVDTNSGGEVIYHNGYAIRRNATDYQTEIFTLLKDATAEEVIDESTVAGLVALNFAADFYTWSNKLSANDVGGLQFVHTGIRNWVYQLALETFYNDMIHYLQTGNVTQTLEVNGGTIVSVVSESVVLGEETVQGYRVDLGWTYNDSSVVNASAYQNSASVVLVSDAEGHFYVTEVTDETS